MAKCEECDGDGEVEIECYACGSQVLETCEECGGSGEIDDDNEKENV